MLEPEHELHAKSDEAVLEVIAVALRFRIELVNAIGAERGDVLGVSRPKDALLRIQGANDPAIVNRWQGCAFS